MHIPRWDPFLLKNATKIRSKTIVESPDLGSDAAEVAQKGRVPTLLKQIENLMNSPVRLQGVKGRGAGDVDVPIIFSINSNEFQAIMQELKSQ